MVAVPQALIVSRPGLLNDESCPRLGRDSDPESDRVPGVESRCTRSNFARYCDAALEAPRSIPGVRVVTTTTLLPFGNCSQGDTFIQEELGDQRTKNPMARSARSRWLLKPTR